MTMSDEFDPEDPKNGKGDIGIPLPWILIPIFLIFGGIIGMTLYHLQHYDFLRQ